MLKIIGLIIGILIAGSGIYYLLQEKDKESKKIYGITTVIGIIIFAVSFLL